MKRTLLQLLTLTLLLAFGQSLQAQSFADIKGKWTLKKKSDRYGGDVTQTLEFKDDKFTFKVASKTGETVLAATGNVKIEKIGRFNVMKLTEIKGGYSESELEPTNDDRHIIFAKGWKSLKIALNFDQERDGEEIEIDSYTQASN